MAGIRKVDRYTEDAAYLAVQIAFLRKRKAVRGNGRRLTNWTLKRYLRGPFLPEVCSILTVALREAASFCNHQPGADPIRVLRFALFDLDQQLAEVVRPAGRPALPVGIMSSPANNLPQRPAGRPRLMSVENERSWVNRVRGAALAAWVFTNTTTGNVSIRTNIDAAVRLFNRNEGSTDDQILAALTKFLSKVMDEGNDLAPPSKNRKALLKRLHVGHRRYELPQKVRGDSR